MKAKVTVIKEEPLTVSIKKNGRRTSLATTKAALSSYYPDINSDQWIIKIGDHSSSAVLLTEAIENIKV
jgi:hypothetical protein